MKTNYFAQLTIENIIRIYSFVFMVCEINVSLHLNNLKRETTTP